MKEKEHIWKGHEIIPADAGYDFFANFCVSFHAALTGWNSRQLSNYGI